MAVTVTLRGVSATVAVGGFVVRRRVRSRPIRPARVPVPSFPGTSLGLIVTETGGTVGCLSPPRAA